MYQLDAHIVSAAAGLTSDANILIDYSRRMAQRYRTTYESPIPVEQLVKQLCDAKQYYTQYGSLRPFGVSFLYAGWDNLHGYQLYCSDPSGNYMAWRAIAIGANNQSASSILKQEYEETMNLRQALGLAAKVICKSMDTTTPSADQFEIVTLTRPDGKNMVYRTLSQNEVSEILQENRLTS